MRPYLRWSWFFVILLFPFSLYATPRCASVLAKAVSSRGRVEYQAVDTYQWRAVSDGDTFCYGDKVRTAINSRVTLLLSNSSMATLDQNTTLIFTLPEQKDSNWLLELFSGSAFFRSRYPQQLNIRTPFINAVHEGTEFLVMVSDQEAKISVFDGIVAAENAAGRLKINKGFVGIAGKNSPPRLRPLNIRPEDAVQWTLYYPPLVDYREWAPGNTKNLRRIMATYRKGDIQGALAQLDALVIAKPDNRFQNLKASILLTVGRVDQAYMIINAVLAREPENSLAYAIRSVIAVTKNRQDQALFLAEKSVSLDQQSALARIALSYAYQSLQKISQAEEAARAAVRLSPDNALAWARLSELQLSSGEHANARVSAHKAYELDPGLARIQTILGFAELAAFDLDEAENAFERAVNLDASDPTARLGLGLVKIRRGDVQQGSRDLEIAVSLDPNNAVARSYLGKAYYELRNAEYAGTEFVIAKDMDSKDPTPWFYDAILKQSANKPIAALHSMEKAIDLNDKRGIYRSRLLLDEDAAARTANLARMYNDLGFGRVALKHAWKSLGHDTSNHSAHRFLADSYIGKPRFRIARASELLQAQLLQPVNITPVQPQLTAENIGILNSLGPSSLSVNEYDPMFTSNGAHVWLNGAYGSNNTLTDNAIVSGVYDNLSLSMGQFHFQTDGFRVNDDYQQDIYNAFAQYSFNQDLSIQVEFKSDDVRSGDVPFRLNGFHQENLRQTIEHDTARVGGHYRIDANQDLTVSAFYFTNTDRLINNSIAPFRVPNFTIQRPSKFEISAKGWQSETQYNFHSEFQNIAAGFGYLNVKENSLSSSSISIFDAGGREVFHNELAPSIGIKETDYFNGYVYSTQKLSSYLISIVGGSFDNYNDGLINISHWSPKVGAIIKPLDNLTLRGAALRVLKRPLAAGQTIEPTQVAGFNQFFDGVDASSMWQFSSGIDYSLFDKLFVGGELNWRRIKEYSINSSLVVEREKKKGVSHLAYLYWTPTDWLAFRAEYHYDKFSREFDVDEGDNTFPQSVATDEVPLSVNLYHESGVFTKFTGTFINQDVAWVRSLQGLPSDTDPLERMDEQFWTFDAALGYRLPKRVGVINFEVKNLFDNNFKYQSIFDASGPQLSSFVPEREFFVKLSLFY